MRIIGGLAKGTVLKSVPGQSTRPTLGRVRESIFSSLGDLSRQVVVDLFAGSGSLGLEALSRGAEQVIFVENNRQVRRVLQRNVEHLSALLARQTGVRPKVEIILADALQVPRRRPDLRERVNIVFADPPYDAVEKGMTGAARMLTNPDFAGWIGSGLLVLEHDKNITLPWYPATGWQLLKCRKFSNCLVSFARNR